MNIDEVFLIFRWRFFHSRYRLFRIEKNFSNKHYWQKISALEWMNYVFVYFFVKNDNRTSIEKISFKCWRIVSFLIWKQNDQSFDRDHSKRKKFIDKNNCRFFQKQIIR